jgi:hypothetical protein
LTSALVGGEWSTSRLGRFTLGESVSGTQWIGVCVCPRAGLDDVEKKQFLTLPGLELQPVAIRYTYYVILTETTITLIIIETRGGEIQKAYI